MMRLIWLSILIVLMIGNAAEAGKRRGYYSPPMQRLPYIQAVSDVESMDTAKAADAMAEVNAARAARGLRPFIQDHGLTAAALACAEFRASRLIAGHSSNDFAFLNGSHASAAGCGAMDASWGWQTCCAWDNWQYAGAAVVIGRDSKRYMQIFVR